MLIDGGNLFWKRNAEKSNSAPSEILKHYSKNVDLQTLLFYNYFWIFLLKYNIFNKLDSNFIEIGTSPSHQINVDQIKNDMRSLKRVMTMGTHAQISILFVENWLALSGKSEYTRKTWAFREFTLYKPVVEIKRFLHTKRFK